MTRTGSSHRTIPPLGQDDGSNLHLLRQPEPRTTVLSVGDEIVGNSDQIRLIKQLVDVVAPSNSAVLITGETGTGKELFARRLHFKSSRRNQPFVPINCAAIPDSLIESELFGFEKGAFSGASFKQEGRLQQAHGGTLFLDEIGDLSYAAQAKLLRALGQKEVQAIGARVPQLIDFRLVAATNRDLEQLVADGKFRPDLLFRVNVVEIEIPPLRARPEDVAPIAGHFLKMFALQHGRPEVNLTAGALGWLERQPWLGNVRQLRNIIERALLFADSPDIKESDLNRVRHSGLRWKLGKPQSRVTKFQKNEPRGRATTGYSSPDIEFSIGSEADRLRAALEKTKWNKSRAADLLHCSRMTIHRKIIQYDLSPGDLESTQEFTLQEPASE